MLLWKYLCMSPFSFKMHVQVWNWLVGYVHAQLYKVINTRDSFLKYLYPFTLLPAEYDFPILLHLHRHSELSYFAISANSVNM